MLLIRRCLLSLEAGVLTWDLDLRYSVEVLRLEAHDVALRHLQGGPLGDEVFFEDALDALLAPDLLELQIELIEVFHLLGLLPLRPLLPRDRVVVERRGLLRRLPRLPRI